MLNREIYHCPYCNLCRVGKGLGIDYFHCMNCNACMSQSLYVHACREKHLEDNCPICHEFIFTSSLPVKALPCGHVMHSACFQVFGSYNSGLFFSWKDTTFQTALLGFSDAATRTTLVLIIPAQSVASHLGICRSVTTFVTISTDLAVMLMSISFCMYFSVHAHVFPDASFNVSPCCEILFSNTMLESLCSIITFEENIFCLEHTSLPECLSE